MTIFERKDERCWRLSGDPVRVDIGPPIFPGCSVDAVPVNELRRVEQHLQGALGRHQDLFLALLDGATMSDTLRARVRQAVSGGGSA